jgi:hypothetical protein
MYDEFSLTELADNFWDSCLRFRAPSLRFREEFLRVTSQALLCLDVAATTLDDDEREWQFRLAGAHLRECRAYLEALPTRKPVAVVLRKLQPLAAYVDIRVGRFVGVVLSGETPVPDSPEKMH